MFDSSSPYSGLIALFPFLLFFLWLVFGSPGQGKLLRLSKSTYVVLCVALIADAVGLQVCIIAGTRGGFLVHKAPPPVVRLPVVASPAVARRAIAPPQKGA